MTKLPEYQENVKNFQDDLRGAVVLVDCLFTLQDTVEDLKNFVTHATEHQMQILKAFGDLYLELSDESKRRQFLDRSIRRLERQAARLQLPIYFWRSEPDRTLKDMVRWRAKYLIHRRKTLPDDVWDILREFIADYAHAEMTDDELAGIVRAAKEGEATNANA